MNYQLGLAWSRSDFVKYVHFQWAQLFLLFLTGEQTDVYFPPFPEPSQVVALSNHTLVNINLNYSATEKLEMYLKLENALNDNYEEVFGYQTLGFGASLGLRYSM